MTRTAKALVQALASQSAEQERPTEPSFVRDLTAQARAGALSPVVGRDDEILQVLEVVSQRRKANAVLIGPAGAGKTAVAEGLALLCALHAARLPRRLQGLRVLQLDVGALMAGAGVYGEIERRMAAVLAQVQAGNSVLFIDELHTLVGAGGRAGHTDLAQQLKPHLARDLRVLAATTAEEYTQIVARDAALERRFSPIYIQPLSDAAALRACEAHARWLQVDLPAARLRTLLRHAVRQARVLLRHRSMPDSAIDLIERSTAMAELSGTALGRHHVARAAARLVHLPDDVERRLRKLRRQEQAATFGPSASVARAMARAADHLLGQLGPSRGPGGQSAGPCVLELADGHDAQVLAEALAHTLGSEVIELDAAASPHEVFGADPGYVGYGQRRPIHRLLDRPFSVVHLQGLHAGAEPRRLLAELRAGSLHDAEGRVMAVHVVVVSGPALGSQSAIGFVRT